MANWMVLLSAALVLVFWTHQAPAQDAGAVPEKMKARAVVVQGTRLMCFRVSEPTEEGVYKSLCVPQSMLVGCLETAVNLTCGGGQRSAPGAVPDNQNHYFQPRYRSREIEA